MPEQLKRSEMTDNDESPLTISPEKVCFIIIKAREFDAKKPIRDRTLRTTRTPQFLKNTRMIRWSRSLHR